MSTSRLDEIRAELAEIREELRRLTALGQSGSASEVDSRFDQRLKLLSRQIELLAEWQEELNRSIR